MANQQWVSLLNTGSARASGPGTSLSGAVGPATISPCQAGALLADVATVNPDGYPGPGSWYAGLLLRVTARGYVTAGGTTSNASLALTANKGNNNSYQTLATTTTLTLGTSISGVQWKLEAFIRCTAVSQTAGAASTQGEWVFPNAVPSTPTTLTTANTITLPLPNATGETSLATIDTTQLTGIGLRATLSAAFGTVACTQWLVEALD